MKKTVSSITDRPILGMHEESLGISNYAHAMVEFIETCSTPLTIGIQGEWGSGKTSLLNLINGFLQERGVGTSWVNTWEYSMFRETHEIVPAVLRGLLENLEAECKRNKHWPKSLSKPAEKVCTAMKTFGRFALDVGVRATMGVEGASRSLGSVTGEVARAEIAEIKEEICNIIQLLIDDRGNPYHKICFFIDDLDRIDPKLAVSVLEALKNLFDIENCVFILAIDYDVVVKGLKSKFGEKTSENEREFRSFFDKIIQVPFSMPVNAYNVENMLRNRFADLGFAAKDEFVGYYTRSITCSVGTNPRGLKRYINTYSLLSRLLELQASVEDFELEDAHRFALFTVIGIQVAYPKIYKLLAADSDFPNWDVEFANAHHLNDNIPEGLDANELCDETWEKYIWNFCEACPYLRPRKYLVLEMLNGLRSVIGDEKVEQVLGVCFQTTSMTEVETSNDRVKEPIARLRFDTLEGFITEQKNRDILPSVLNSLSEVHALVEGERWSNGLKINYTPKFISFCANVSTRQKVFIFCHLQKKSLKLIFPAAKNEAQDVPTRYKDSPTVVLRAVKGPNGYSKNLKIDLEEIRTLAKKSYTGLLNYSVNED